MFRRTLPLVARVGAASAACGLAGASALAAAEEKPSAADKSKPKCLQMSLLAESSKAVLAAFPPEHARVLTDRVLIRTCMSVETEEVPVAPLAILRDGSSQSALVAPSRRLWEGPAETTNGVGYPVLPISVADDEDEGEDEAPAPTGEPGATASAPPPPPPPQADAPATNFKPAGGSSIVGPAAAAAPPPPPAPAVAPPASEPAAEPPQPPTLWEQIEEPWRLLEAAGVLTIERDEDAMPRSASLAMGAVAWTGDVADPSPAHPKRTRRIAVSLVSPEAATKLNMRARTAAPECGFCRFMKNGPCGDVFVAWEACIDAARDSGEDFVELCGRPTLDLKACTDAHPEYYGDIAGPPAGEKGDEKPEAAAPA